METRDNKQLKDNELEDVNGGKVLESRLDVVLEGRDIGLLKSNRETTDVVIADIPPKDRDIAM